MEPRKGRRELSVLCCTPVTAAGITREEAERTAAVFRALGDPARVRIVSLLANSPDPVCVCEFTEALGLSQGTVSFHLKKLLNEGLLEREQRGTWAYYSLRRDVLAQLGEALNPEGVLA